MLICKWSFPSSSNSIEWCFAFGRCVYRHVSNLPVCDVMILGQIFGLRRPRAGEYGENGAFGGWHGETSAAPGQQRPLATYQLSGRSAAGTCGTKQDRSVMPQTERAELALSDWLDYWPSGWITVVRANPLTGWITNFKDQLTLWLSYWLEAVP
jgi:hypothetical protein